MSTNQLIQQGGRLGRYQLITRLATGGMAEVWLARATGAKGFQKTIVVKTILPHLAEDPDFLNMFINEALLAAALNHPNIVQIFDLGQIGERYFIAMEFIVGRTMRQIQRVLRKKHKVMPVWLVLRVIVAVCDALEYAHNRRGDDGEVLGIVHRDITPENIMISFSGVTKVVDFGIAKATTSAMITQGGKIKGKLSYLAPEQIIPAGTSQVDRRTDIYALGVVLYEMLTGVRPFRASNDIALLLKIPKEIPTPPSEIARWVPTRLSDIVMRALEKDPGRRYQSGRELGADLESFLTSVGMYPTERQVSEYMCKLFDEEERKVIATGTLAAKAVGKDSFEVSSGSDIKGPDSAGSITVDIPESALVSTAVSESLEPVPQSPIPMNVDRALRDSGVQLSAGARPPEGQESPRQQAVPPPVPRRSPSHASPPPIPPDAVSKREAKPPSKVPSSVPTPKPKALAKPSTRPAKPAAVKPAPTEAEQPKAEISSSAPEPESAQRTEPDISLEVTGSVGADVPQIEVPALDGLDLSKTPAVEVDMAESPSVAAPSTKKAPPSKPAKSEKKEKKEKKQEKKPAKPSLGDDISIELGSAGASAVVDVPDIEVLKASVTSIEVDAPDVPALEIPVGSAAPIEVDASDSSDVEVPPSVVKSATPAPAPTATETPVPTRTVWSGRPTRSIAWDAVVQRSITEMEEERGSDELNGEALAGAGDLSRDLEHLDEDLRDSQISPHDITPLSATHAWDMLVRRANEETDRERDVDVQGFDEPEELGTLVSGHEEMHHQPVHMWDAFIKKHSVEVEVPTSTKSWGGSAERRRPGDRENADDPWSSSSIVEPHTEAASAFDEGLALVREGKREEARRAWERAVELWPDNKKYQVNLRLLRKATGGDDERGE